MSILLIVLSAVLQMEHVPKAPTIQINAPTLPVDPGKNIRLSINAIDKIDTLVSANYIWIVQPPVDDLDEWPDHTHISFGSGIVPTTFNVTVIGSFIFQTPDKTISQSFQTARVTVSVMRPPLPPPTPGPTPGPGPNLPDGKYKMAAYMYNLAGRMPADQCRALADSLSSVAKKARENAFPTKAAMIQATKDGDTAALGANLPAWKPILDSLAVKMNSLKNVLITPADVSVAYDELAIGLSSVGN